MALRYVASTSVVPFGYKLRIAHRYKRRLFCVVALQNLKIQRAKEARES